MRLLTLLDGTGPSPQPRANTALPRCTSPSRVGECPEAITWLEKALDMRPRRRRQGRRSEGSSEPRSDHLVIGEVQQANEEVNQGLQMALNLGEEDMAGNIFQAVAYIPWMQFDFAEAHARMEEAVRYTADHDLHGHLMCALGVRDHDEAGPWPVGRGDERGPNDLLYVRNTGRASRIEPLMAIGLAGGAARRPGRRLGLPRRGRRIHRRRPKASDTRVRSRWRAVRPICWRATTKQCAPRRSTGTRSRFASRTRK